MPRVSVIISTYNRAHFICDAINSVLKQTFKDSEIIVVNNGSTDNTTEALEQYGSSIRCLCFQINQGRAEGKNAGIKAAQGEYIAFLDDDDIWLPNKLEKQVAYLDSCPDTGLVHAFTEVIDVQGRLLKDATKKRLKFYRKALRLGYTYEGISRLCILFISTVMVRKKCLDQVGLLDPHTDGFEDWDFYLRFALKYRIGTILKPLVKFRVHGAHTTAQEFTRGRIRTAEKHLALLGSDNALSSNKRLRRNFYLHLANAHYINRQLGTQLGTFRIYALKALKLNPFVLFQSRLGLHLLMSLMPFEFRQRLDEWKNLQFDKVRLYPEHIIPHQTPGGPWARHLKHYDFVNGFCINKVVLDAACGTGYGAHYLSQAAKEVIGVDISQKAIAYAREHYQKPNIKFTAMDVCKLVFPDKYFDTVCSLETLEHLSEPEKFISEVKRVLKENGVFILSTPHVKKTNYNPKNPYHKVEFSRKDFQDILVKYFTAVEILGQRRKQSTAHYYLQKMDIFQIGRASCRERV